MRVLIVGGGIVGLTLAGELARRRVRVLLIDRGGFGREASLAGAGMLARVSALGEQEGVVRAVEEACAEYPGWVEDLRKGELGDLEYTEEDALGLFRDGEGEEAARALASEAAAQGVPAEVLGRDALSRLEPDLAPGFRGALRFPQMGLVDPAPLLRALEREAVRLGVETAAFDPARGFRTKGARVTAVEGVEGAREADAVVLAAGAWCGELGRLLGVEIPIFPLRGQMLRLGGRPGLLRRVLFHAGGYLIPRRDGTVYVGSTLERVGFAKSPTAKGVGTLGRLVVSCRPDLADLPLLGAGAGLRPGSPDGWPLVGRVPGFENLWICSGHATHGHLLGPWTARRLTAEVLSGRPSEALAPFRPDRSPLPSRPPWWTRLCRGVSMSSLMEEGGAFR